MNRHDKNRVINKITGAEIQNDPYFHMEIEELIAKRSDIKTSKEVYLNG